MNAAGEVYCTYGGTINHFDASNALIASLNTAASTLGDIDLSADGTIVATEPWFGNPLQVVLTDENLAASSNFYLGQATDAIFVAFTDPAPIVPTGVCAGEFGGGGAGGGGGSGGAAGAGGAGTTGAGGAGGSSGAGGAATSSGVGGAGGGAGNGGAGTGGAGGATGGAGTTSGGVKRPEAPEERALQVGWAAGRLRVAAPGTRAPP